MNRIKFTLSMVFAAALGTQFAFAGGSGSHGGGVYECHGRFVTLVDLWNAKIPGEVTEGGLRIVFSNDEVEAQVQRAIERLRPMSQGFADRVAKAYEHAKKIRVPVPAGYMIPPPDDVSLEIIPENCVLRGAASYNDEKDRLRMDDRYVSRMDRTDVAALWFHEAVYKVLRETEKVPNSRLAQQIVGYMFSDLSAEKIPLLISSNLHYHRGVEIRFYPERSEEIWVSMAPLTADPLCREQRVLADTHPYESPEVHFNNRSFADPKNSRLAAHLSESGKLYRLLALETNHTNATRAVRFRIDDEKVSVTRDCQFEVRVHDVYGKQVYKMELTTGSQWEIELRLHDDRR